MGFPAYSPAALDLVPPEHLEPPPGDELRYLVRDVLRALDRASASGHGAPARGRGGVGGRAAGRGGVRCGERAAAAGDTARPAGAANACARGVRPPVDAEIAFFAPRLARGPGRARVAPSRSRGWPLAPQAGAADPR